MANIEEIVREINKDLVPEFEKKLRAYLVEQEKDWLVEQIIRLTLDAHSLEEMDRKHIQEEGRRKRQARLERVRALALDENKLQEFVARYRDDSRDKLIRKNLLSKNAPAKGGELITEEFRTAKGNELLQHARDLVFGFLFGDENTNTHFHRTQKRLLILTLPRMKSETLDFMKAKTELSARGTWHDPESGAGDVRADNVVLEIEYGETEDQSISNGIIAALRLINNLELNEQALYGRIEKVEQSTLIS